LATTLKEITSQIADKHLLYFLEIEGSTNADDFASLINQEDFFSEAG
jgi:hypothetical protein